VNTGHRLVRLLGRAFFLGVLGGTGLNDDGPDNGGAPGPTRRPPIGSDTVDLLEPLQHWPAAPSKAVHALRFGQCALPDPQAC
jgi:hypothetical protein